MPSLPFLRRVAGAAVLAFAAAGAHANATADAFSDQPFAVASDGFNALISARITTAQLVNGIAGNVGLPAPSAGGIFSRTSGTAYPASFGIYEFAGTHSSFEYAVTHAASGVTSIVLQTFITVSNSEGVYGILGTGNLPHLSYNGGNQFLTATTTNVQAVSGGFDINGDPLAADPNNPNYVTFTWDLSSVNAAIDSFKLTWATDAHANTLAFQVDQIGAVPEPQTLALALAALGFITLNRWSARRRGAPA